MSKLQWALHWASRGFPVFPLVENGKEPIHDDWPSIATVDHDTIQRMWTDPVLRNERGYNIGTLCTGRVVVDVDVKNGKDGHNQYVGMGGNYDTLVVQTPTGGYHCYFDGPDSANVSIAPDVDIRSHRGFVVAPGSTIDGGAYQIVVDRVPAWVPVAVQQRLHGPHERREGSVAEAIDSAASVEAGIRFLQSAPPAVEGQRGDETTFVTAARLVRELALSVDTAFELMWEHFNPRCEPPWGYDELRGKVENAAQYGSADMGRLDPSVIFGAVPDMAPPPSPFAHQGIVFGNALVPSAITPRPWMVDRMLMLHETTVWLAAGSAGKSSAALALAAHLALGKDFGPFKTHTRCKSIVYNGEDDVAEQSRRLYAVCQCYGFDYAEVSAQILLLSEDQVELKLAVAAGPDAAENSTMVRQLVDLASNPEVGAIIYDPLVDVHAVDENSNIHMNVVMKVIKRVGKMANVASLVLHHATKGGASRTDDRAGNADISRGASAIINKARIAYTMMSASLQDVEDYGLQDADRGMWVRMDDAKMNLSLASLEPLLWFRKEGVKIITGDIIGALKTSELKKDTMHIKVRLAELLMDTMTGNGTASMTISQAVAVVKTSEPLYANRTDTDIKKRIEGLFATAIEVRGRVLHAAREGEGTKATLNIRMS